jgi:hypothetical protein
MPIAQALENESVIWHAKNMHENEFVHWFKARYDESMLVASIIYGRIVGAKS